VEFNREQRRKLKKRLNKSGLSLDAAMELLERRLQAMASDALLEGTKVRLNYESIVNQPSYSKRQQSYRDFVEANKETEFTVQYDDKHTSGKLVCLAEDTSEQKWLWHVGDLIAVEPVGESVDDSIAPKEESNGGDTEIQQGDIPEAEVSE